MEQSWLPLPTSTVVFNTTYLPNKRDAEIRRTLTAEGTLRKKREMATQQGIQESYYRDMAVMFGKWKFDPMALPEPPCPVHLWQGDEDGLVRPAPSSASVSPRRRADGKLQVCAAWWASLVTATRRATARGKEPSKSDASARSSTSDLAPDGDARRGPTK
ncbi:uncharacterized protein LOC119281700 [Triticum dicoccoides]|uniref:Uncharacterized protein n=1 Tax=Triticum turgidum subsp. durum TaxID=4567 RepID=A0A9R1QQ86_TRITD|nr:uncharacterized protein LOC119281700 [Triticum dicoccoides]XP_044345030.1 uncharacterized protein LOC123065899 [Triticum aestivum]VAH81600.1 unnamed protein product [Triticum turgidum subsp. durum]